MPPQSDADENRPAEAEEQENAQETPQSNEAEVSADSETQDASSVDAPEGTQEEPSDQEEAGQEAEFPEAEAGEDAPLPEEEGFELDAEEMPDGKRAAEEGVEIDASDLGEEEAIGLDDLGDAAETPDDVEMETPEAPPRRGAHRLIIVANALVSLAVIAMVGIVLWRKHSQEELAKEEPPAPAGYTYLTRPGDPARPIEKALVAAGFQRSDLGAIQRAADKPEQCRIVIRLPNVYFDQDTELKPDAEKKAVNAVRAVFQAEPQVKRITVVALFKFKLDPGAKPEPALTVTATRAQHEKADYSKSPAEALRAFEAKYHPSLK